ncbi:hypothetical protein [Kocuria flava]|uniref:hypothetical protein n=1 Tax=Kocuria flava TaxID=446860 RepID=UPI002F93E785
MGAPPPPGTRDGGRTTATEQQPDPGSFEDQPAVQREDGIVLEPGGEPAEELARQDPPAEEERP